MLQDFFKAHHTSIMIGALWVSSAAIGAMPMPNDKSSPFYQWAFKFLNTLAANVSRAFAVKNPGVPLPPNGNGK